MIYLEEVIVDKLHRLIADFLNQMVLVISNRITKQVTLEWANNNKQQVVKQTLLLTVQT